ncbi:MAG: hypothetical protein CSA22_08075 [Deltaproteobacteria bacterium]|nr:MAG: hypothetical protein CSA22_08075 [Deltaproteobacteria bacterium]
MNTVPEYYKAFASTNFLVPDKPSASPFFQELRMAVDQNLGHGYSEMLRMHNGPYVVLTDYCLRHRLDTCQRNAQTPFQLAMLLSGHAEFQTSNRTKRPLATGDIWFFHGPFEQIVRTHFPGKKIRGLSIYLSQELIEAWLGTSSCVASKGLEKLACNHSGQQVIPLAKGLQPSSAFMDIARKLIHANRQTLADNLRFESLALDLVSRILSLEDASADSCFERTRRTRAVVDEAVDILGREWNAPPNISTLARRVGVNASYLKEWFRQQMNMPIGAYIREQRMKKALEMIESGRYSILKTALFVGYSNPSHFSTAFKKCHGHLPSYYLPRHSKTA